MVLDVIAAACEEVVVRQVAWNLIVAARVMVSSSVLEPA